MKKAEEFNELKNLIQKEKKIMQEISSSINYYQNSDAEERKMVSVHINVLKSELLKTNEKIPEEIKKISLVKKLPDDSQKKSVEYPKGKIVEEIKKTDVQKLEVGQYPLTKQEQPKLEEKIDNSKIKISYPKRTFIEKVGLDVFFSRDELKPNELEKETIKRIKKKREEIILQKKEKPNNYVTNANRFFSEYSKELRDKKIFPNLKEDLIKST